MIRTVLLFVFAATLVLATPARSAVVDSAKHGFRVSIEMEINAPAREIYTAFVDDVDNWWEKSHTYSGDAKKLYIEAEPKGWFGERIPGGGCVCDLQVVYVRPSEALRFTGGLGPLQEMGVEGALTIRFQSTSEDSAHVTVSYNVSGYDPGGLDKLAMPVDSVLSAQLRRLKAFVEGPADH